MSVDSKIEDILHVGAAWITHDGAIPERARTPLHATLAPADNLATRDRFGGELAQPVDARDAA
jgi:hypothetical protein